MDLQTFFENFDTIAEAPGGIDKLRSLILDLAVRGKLVPQNFQEANSPEIKSKAIRSDNLIPKNWVYINLQNIVKLKSGNTLNKDLERSRNGIPYLKVGDMNLPGNEVEIRVSSRYVSKEEIHERNIIPPNTIIFPKRGGAIATNKKRFVKQEILVDSNIMALVCDKTNDLSLPYLYQWFSTIDLGLLNTGTSVPQVNNKDIGPLLIPIPPLAEQKRIVAKVDELMALCDRLQAAQEKRDRDRKKLRASAFDALTNAPTDKDLKQAWAFVRDRWNDLNQHPEDVKEMRSIVLDLAVKGKLTQQDFNEESAYDWIQDLKHLNSTKSSTKYSSPTITKSKVPYKIPENWHWVRLNEISQIGTGSTPLKSRSDFYADGNIPWVTSKATGNDFISEAEVFVTDIAVEEHRLKLYKPGTLLIAMYGQGKTRGQVSCLEIEATINQACAAVCLLDSNFDLREYVRFLFKKKYEEIRALASGGAQPNLNLGKIKETLVPLPPIEEQKRVVLCM